MERALKIGQTIGVFIGTMGLGLLAFWQWLVADYATGWTIVISGLVYVAFMLFILVNSARFAKDAATMGALNMGLMFSVFVGMGCLMAGQQVYEGETIITHEADGSIGIYTSERTRYYSPFHAEVDILDTSSEGSVRLGLNTMCTEGMCEVEVDGEYKVSQAFVLSAIAVGREEEYEYRSMVTESIRETILQDKPFMSQELEEGTERRINLRLGLPADAECPIKVNLFLRSDGDLRPFGLDD